MKNPLWMLVCLLLFPFAVVRAQGEVVVTAPASDQPIVIRYVADRLIQVETVMDAVQAATPLYRLMFPEVARFNLFVDLVAEDDPVNYALTRRETIDVPATTDGTRGFSGRQEVCRVRLYNSSEFGFVSKLRHNIAHELAHCYQSYGVNDAGLNDATNLDWWFEGTAEWMASLAYDAGDSIIIGDTRSQFVNAVRDNAKLFDLHYTAQFFWDYLGDRMPLEFVGNLLRDMPTHTRHLSHLESRIPQFSLAYHGYAQALANNAVTAQPDANLLFATSTLTADASAPVSVNLPLAEMSVRFHTLELTGLGASRGVRLRYDKGSSSSHLSLDNGIMLGPDVFEICAPGPFRLVQSQTLGGDTPVLRIEPFDCTPPPPATVDACVIGYWTLDIRNGFGPDGGPKSPVLWGGYTLNISASGLFIANMNLRVFEPRSSQVMSMSFYAVIQASNIPNGGPLTGRAVVNTPMTVEINGVSSTIPIDRSAGTGGLNLRCDGDRLIGFDPASGVSFTFLRR